MAVPLSRSRARLLAACATAGLLVAAGSAGAAAAPDAPVSPASSAPSTGSAAPSATSGSPSAAPRKPAVTAPPPPTDDGPPCTTNTKVLNPVVCLPAGFGEDHAAQLTPGNDVEFAAQVVNKGATRSDATVVITLPQGLQLESDEDEDREAVYRIDGWYDDDEDGNYTGLHCTGGPSTITCDVGALERNANILVGVDLEVSADAVPGSTLTFGVALQRAATDTNVSPYAPTSVSARIDVLAPSHLEVSLTPATVRTIVGHRATMTGIVHNAGPATAPDTVAVAIDVDERHPDKTHFTITNGVDPTEGGADGGGSAGSGESSASGGEPVDGGGTTVVVIGAQPAAGVRGQLERHALARHAMSARHRALPSLRFWPLGTIAPGATARVRIKLKALSVGTDTLTFGAISVTGGADCFEDGGGSGSGTDSGAPSATPLDREPQAVSTTSAPASCPFVLETHITAIPKPAATAPLANTGSHLDKELGIALWAVLFGALLVWFGRRRVPARRTHR